MASGQKGPFLPKFGEWDEKNPAAAEGFTVIFNRARDNKKNGVVGTATTPTTTTTPNNNNVMPHQNRYQNQHKNFEPPKKNQQHKYTEKQKGWGCWGRCFW